MHRDKNEKLGQELRKATADLNFWVRNRHEHLKRPSPPTAQDWQKWDAKLPPLGPPPASAAWLFSEEFLGQFRAVARPDIARTHGRASVSPQRRLERAVMSSQGDFLKPKGKGEKEEKGKSQRMRVTRLTEKSKAGEKRVAADWWKEQESILEAETEPKQLNLF